MISYNNSFDQHSLAMWIRPRISSFSFGATFKDQVVGRGRSFWQTSHGGLSSRRPSGEGTPLLRIPRGRAFRDSPGVGALLGRLVGVGVKVGVGVVGEEGGVYSLRWLLVDLTSMKHSVGENDQCAETHKQNGEVQRRELSIICSLAWWRHVSWGFPTRDVTDPRLQAYHNV